MPFKTLVLETRFYKTLTTALSAESLQAVWRGDNLQNREMIRGTTGDRNAVRISGKLTKYSTVRLGKLAESLKYPVYLQL